MSLSAQLFGRDSFIFKATNALGLGIPGWLDKKFGAKGTEGPRLDDLSVQTSTYGADIPRLYGTISMAGNILWLEGGKLKEVVKKNKKGGKGGASTTPTKTYTYYATFALGLCEGPIAGVRRIWCSDTLLYNAGSDDLETIISSNANAKGWKLYLGGDDQQPDTRYEADVGVGNAPAFRGLSYLVFYDFELTDYANTLQASQFKVEIVQSSESKTPTLLNSEILNSEGSYQDLYQVSSLYSDRSGFVSLYRADSSSIVNRYSLGPSYIHHDNSAGTSQSEFLLGESDVDGFAISSTESIVVFDDAGNQKSNWDFAGVNWSNARFYSYLGVEYLCVQSTTSTKVYSKDIDSQTVSILIDSDDYSTYGRLQDICFGSSFLYALSFSHILSCYDLQANILWIVDLSAEKDLLGNSGFSGSPVVFREHDGKVLLRKGSKFWIAEKSGYRYLGDANIPGMGSGNCSDSVKLGVWFHYNNASRTYYFVDVLSLSYSDEVLSDLIETECQLCTQLLSSDIDVESMGVNIAGYKVSSGSIRSALEPLQQAYPFDVVQRGYKISFLPRGRDSIAVIRADELYAGEDGGDEALSQAREMDSQIPNRIVVKYLDASREYDVSQQQYQRASTSSVGETSLDLALVLTADKAAQVAEILCYLAWLERVEFSFTLPPIYSAIEPADVVTLYDDKVSYELRINETTQGIEGRIECKAVPNRAALYESQAKGGTGFISSGVVTLPGKSLAILLDAPVVDENIQDAPGFIAAVTGYTAGWPGAVLIGSSDNGQTYADLQGFAGKGTFGAVSGQLAVNGGTLIDMSSVSVSLVSGQLESITRDQMLSGVNYAAYGEDGRWEIVRFQNAVLQSDGSYLVSGFLRGQRGTEWATGLHEENDWFVLLDDSDNAFIDLPTSALGESRLYKAVTSRQSSADASDQEFTYKGVNLQPLSPVYARGSRNSGSLTVTWTRRSRLSNSWWTAGVVAPLGEAIESYQVDVVSDSTVVRTIASSSAAITYTAEQQQADFGSVQSSINIRIFQLSAAVGRGRALEVTL